jgi:hypothetical protein
MKHDTIFVSAQPIHQFCQGTENTSIVTRESGRLLSLAMRQSRPVDFGEPLSAPMSCAGVLPVGLFFKVQWRTGGSLRLQIDSHLDAISDLNERNATVHSEFLAVEGHCPLHFTLPCRSRRCLVY